MVTSVLDGFNVCILAYGQVCRCKAVHGLLMTRCCGQHQLDLLQGSYTQLLHELSHVPTCVCGLQTGSGKTHTMEGLSSDPGINARTLAGLFELSRQRAAQTEHTIVISLLEVSCDAERMRADRGSRCLLRSMASCQRALQMLRQTSQLIVQPL